ncbi:MAG: cysteine-rich CWC family protein [Gammaproteobacteria bacterium]|nr:cysteine-rich CWC family protein [Gammaproteobacteria bacterium]
MAVTKHCSRCGARFDCGRDDAGCWCQGLPLLPASALDAAADCLCPRCLEAATAAAGAARAAPDDPPADPDPAA